MYFKCPRCGNDDIKRIGYINGLPYCRSCITFKSINKIEKTIRPNVCNIYLDYELSKEQKVLSDRLLENFKSGINSFVYAVCGSGKTEIVLNTIRYAISIGYKVGFVIPRRDVVIEIHERLQNIFKDNKVIAVYGGHSKLVEGDIICLTSHQLYRYEQYFDLLILDEIDAFPYKGNIVLNALYRLSLTGFFIEMSATPSKEELEIYKSKGVDILTLFKRYHGGLLPVPQVILKNSIFRYLSLFSCLKRYEKNKKPVLIFCPTIDMCLSVFRILCLRFRSINYVHSKRKERIQVIDDFKKGKTLFLCTTAVLERGVTIKDLQVVVFNADHPVYTEFALVQIAGRVGRKKDSKEGDVIFICEEKTKDIINAIETINSANKNV